ncbi:hypothetical protein fugu_016503 [Takifugu bimaculatus]|uniref:Uncharacterized protein n=1 Tax=Takifugu bimaculatus TaxID=433685 RepID=A0A4Z2BVQ3_9TELE|nr:hypothetical protein fugu_016503 [Takifugu bimaculatus]
MQLDFKLKKKKKEMKKRTFYALSAFSHSSGIVNKCLFSDYFCLSSTMPPPHLGFSFKKRVNCIVDSTVSSVYETIQIHVTPPPPFLWSFLWLSVNAQISAPPPPPNPRCFAPPPRFPPRHQIKMTTDYTFV